MVLVKVGKPTKSRSPQRTIPRPKISLNKDTGASGSNGSEQKRLGKSRIQGYLFKILSKRAELSSLSPKPFQPWRCAEVECYYIGYRLT